MARGYRRGGKKNYITNNLRKAEKAGDETAVLYWQAQLDRIEAGFKIPDNYTVSAGDTVEQIAMDLYGDPRAAFDIMAANPDVFGYDSATGAYNTTIQPGQTLDIPQGAVGGAYVAPGTRTSSAGPGGNYVTTYTTDGTTATTGTEEAAKPPDTITAPPEDQPKGSPGGAPPSGRYERNLGPTTPPPLSAEGARYDRQANLGYEGNALQLEGPGQATPPPPLPAASSANAQLYPQGQLATSLEFSTNIFKTQGTIAGGGAKGPGTPYAVPPPIGPLPGTAEQTSAGATAPTSYTDARGNEIANTSTSDFSSQAARQTVEAMQQGVFPPIIPEQSRAHLGIDPFNGINGMMDKGYAYNSTLDAWVYSAPTDGSTGNVSAGGTPGAYPGYFIPTRGYQLRPGAKYPRPRGGGSKSKGSKQGYSRDISNWRIGF